VKKNNEVLINVFKVDLLLGSPQIMHFYESEIELQTNFDKYQVENEIDHSFIYFNSPTSAIVKWKNKAGNIQFCGSAAYGISWIASQFFGAKEFKLYSEKNKLLSSTKDGAVYLEIPSILPKALKEGERGNLFLDSESGIYLFKALEESLLLDDQWIQNFLKGDQLLGVHGFCLFFWDTKKNTGKLRYFTPWHGRDEDYVTGSIHQYLTPLVNQLYSQANQSWEQVSKNGGRLISSIKDQNVLLKGNCTTEDKAEILKITIKDFI
jgi:hypothetical protein